MFNLIKPGHALNFGTCPSGIISPHGTNGGDLHGANATDNTDVMLWPQGNNLGAVQCISHPDGALGPMAQNVATHMRGGIGIMRSLSYSGLGRDRTPANRNLGQLNAAFVGYADGMTYYSVSPGNVMSKDFSGCVMASYSINGQRRVAHASASAVAHMDCKQEFLNTIQAQNAVLHGWFRPFIDARDGARRMAAYHRIRGYVNNNPYAITTFGAITAGNVAYSIDAFKPHGVVGNRWIVTHVAQHPMSQAWIIP